MLLKVAPEVGPSFPGDRIVIDAAFPAAADNPKLTAAASSVEIAWCNLNSAASAREAETYEAARAGLASSGQFTSFSGQSLFEGRPFRWRAAALALDDLRPASSPPLQPGNATLDLPSATGRLSHHRIERLALVALLGVV
jgi:hypothetical protein